MKTKTICINYKGRKIQIEGYDENKFICYCDLSISVKPFGHTLKRVMYVCEIKTRIGNKVSVLCASCYRRFKKAKWFNALIERKELYDTKSPSEQQEPQGDWVVRTEEPL